MNDSDYTPAYQNEYRRLWHKSQTENARLRKALGIALDYLDLEQSIAIREALGPSSGEGEKGLEAKNAKLREALAKIAAGGHTHAADEIRIAREALAAADEGEK